MKPVAALVSEYRPNSHADVIVGRALGGYYYNGAHHEPRIDVVSMFTDQVPDMDMSRDLAREHGFKLVPSIRHALTMTSDQSFGARELAVEGVLLICEHGAYPYNALGQKLYPRFEFFKAVLDVFRETGQTAPVFLDKHLSWDWHKARWMYDQARELDFPFMAGSVIPLARHPDLRWPWQQPMTHAVQLWHADFVDNKESYGFHALEALQSMVERRAGGETGLVSVQMIEGDEVWRWRDSGAGKWSVPLLNQALARSPNVKNGRMEDNCNDPALFLLKYRDGLEAVAYMLSGHCSSWDFAAQVDSKTVSTHFGPVPQTRDLTHFDGLTHVIEELFDTGTQLYPMERTLLTTGALAFLFESKERKEAVQTPQLGIRYQAPRDTFFQRS